MGFIEVFNDSGEMLGVEGSGGASPQVSTEGPSDPGRPRRMVRSLTICPWSSSNFANLVSSGASTPGEPGNLPSTYCNEPFRFPDLSGVEGRLESSATDEERLHLGNSQGSQRLPWTVRCRNLEAQMVKMLAETEINRR